MIRLSEQDRSRWNRDQIVEGHALVRACLRRNRPGPFQIQAAIAAVHADADHGGGTDWAQIVALYDQLLAVQPTAVVALNRAIAVGEQRGAEAGLDVLESVDVERPRRVPAVPRRSADLLARAGRIERSVRRLRPGDRVDRQSDRAGVPGSRRAEQHLRPDMKPDMKRPEP